MILGTPMTAIMSTLSVASLGNSLRERVFATGWMAWCCSQCERSSPGARTAEKSRVMSIRPQHASERDELPGF